MDLESSWLIYHAGIRVFTDNNKISVELKAFDKPRYRQEGIGKKILNKTWFNLVVHFYLSDTNEGIIELWQDGEKIIDERGKTLVLDNTIYNILQVGITATKKETILYVDDVKVSNNSLLK